MTKVSKKNILMFIGITLFVSFRVILIAKTGLFDSSIPVTIKDIFLYILIIVTSATISLLTVKFFKNGVASTVAFLGAVLLFDPFIPLILNGALYCIGAVVTLIVIAIIFKHGCDKIGLITLGFYSLIMSITFEASVFNLIPMITGLYIIAALSENEDKTSGKIFDGLLASICPSIAGIIICEIFSSVFGSNYRAFYMNLCAGNYPNSIFENQNSTFNLLTVGFKIISILIAAICLTFIIYFYITYKKNTSSDKLKNKSKKKKPDYTSSKTLIIVFAVLYILFALGCLLTKKYEAVCLIAFEPIILLLYLYKVKEKTTVSLIEKTDRTFSVYIIIPIVLIILYVGLGAYSATELYGKAAFMLVN